MSGGGRPRTGEAAGPPPDYVRLHAQARPGHVACVDLGSGARWTWAELHRDAARWAATLRDGHGIGPGERVAVLAKNSVPQLLVWLACIRLGAVFVPLNWRLAPPELRGMLDDCEPALLCHDGEHAGAAGAIARCIPAASLDALAESARGGTGVDGGGEAAPAGAPRDVPGPDDDAPSLILYTSGTSGRPKGVPVSERNAFHTALNYATLGRVTPSSVLLCDAPMFHVIGLVASIRSILMRGGTLLLSPGFDPVLTLARLGDPALGVTHYFCVPQMADRLRAVPGFEPARLRGLTALFTGGAPNPPANVRRWLADGVKMVDGYGMTEAGTVLGMSLDPEVIDRKAGSAGVAPPTIELRLVDPEGRDVPAGEVGELWLRGPNVMRGYWRRPGETAAAFADGGWFRSGDLARRDAEGYVTIVGRRKEMYISGGENVYPAEVEALLAEHPGVAEVAVVGVPDAQWGEVGVAHVVAAPGSALDEAALRAHCEGRIARYKIPRRWVFTAALPRTTTGKVAKQALKPGAP